MIKYIIINIKDNRAIYDIDNNNTLFTSFEMANKIAEKLFFNKNEYLIIRIFLKGQQS